MRALKILKIAAISVLFLSISFSNDLRWLALGICGFIWFVLFARWQPVLSSHRRELAALALTAIIAYVLGFRIEGVRGLGNHYWQLGVLSLPTTVLWIMLIARSLRFVYDQGSSPLILKVMWVVCVAFLGIGLLQSQLILFALLLACMLLIGLSCALFRRVNVSAITAQGLGVILALLTISGVLKTSATLALFAPIFILGLPPLTFHSALGLIHLPVKRRLTEDQLFALYASLSALGIIAVTWAQRPEWLAWITLSSALGLSLPLALHYAVKWSTAWETTAQHIQLFGVFFNRVCFEEAVERIEQFIKTKTPHLIVTPDTTALVKAQKDPAFRRCYAQADLVTADGTGIVWASRWLGTPLPQRVTGIDIVQALCREAAVKGYRVFLLGAHPGIAEAAATRLKQTYPGLCIVGTHYGYFQDDEPAVVRQIQAARPDILFVGMGAPRQEQWLLRHRDVLGVPAMLGVGGSFDVLSGRLSRAPQWLQRSGLEWLYRVYLEPRRVGRALLIPLFLFKVLGIKSGLWIQKWVYRSAASTTSANSN